MSDCHFDLTCRLAEKINPDKWCKSVDVETENLNFSMSDLPCTVRINDDKGNAYSFGTGSQYVDDLSVSKVDITPGCKVEFRSTNSYGHSTLKHLEYGMGMGATDLSLENIAYFAENIPSLLEVSIGHALICESLYLGFENVIPMYLQRLNI